MNTFYTEHINSGLVTLVDDEHKHAVKVLRKKVGDAIRVINGYGADIEAEIISISRDTTTAKVLLEIKKEPPAFKVSICVGMLKSIDRYDFFLQKAVELGATDIYPMKTERTVLSVESGKKRMARWKKIIVSACKQCERAWFPSLHEPQDYNTLMQNASGQVVLYYEMEKHFLSTIELHVDIIIFIGPEGGFEEREVNLAKEKEALISGLGEEVLRTETAAMLALSIVKIKNLEKG